MFENEVNKLFALSFRIIVLQFSRQPKKICLSPHRERPLS